MRKKYSYLFGGENLSIEYCGEIKPSNTMYRASCSDGESHHFF